MRWFRRCGAAESILLFPVRSLGSSFDLIPYSRTMVLGTTEPKTDMTTRDLRDGGGGVKVWPAGA